jgi:hypothetical protein
MSEENKNKARFEYGGYTLEFNEREESWTIFGQEGELTTHKNCALAKERVDKMNTRKKEKKEFQRVKALVDKGWGEGWKQGEVTSFAEIGYGGRACYWTSVGGKREKVEADKIRAHTDENLAKLKQAQQLKASASSINKQAEDLLETLEKITLPTE